ncbi:exodeoxyribonuclease V subunit alpha [Winogradskya humida]|uniref:RecBCD enzyme subunit RecD n=1 Tax=Winogradskya humida TaxID=113566 RepID=A0ABQ3ZYX9_9ACTN|nr:exodeoxyribonuclease V subunit alpha [Actinoplanes humidus]GIE23804.1 RecBCD enzyme subunit RecD [Actinoplanes humidus]
MTLALRATGLLQVFNTAGVLALADVHTARRVSALGGESDETVLLAFALTVRALRLGSVCVDLTTVAGTATGDEDVVTGDLPWPAPAEWVRTCARSPLVAPGGPLRLVRELLYLDRYWRQEELVRHHLEQRARSTPLFDSARLNTDLDALFPGADSECQRLAAAVAVHRWTTVLAGGPGTGKTTTIARILAALHHQPGDPPRIALAAPTGKAAARLEEAVRACDLPHLGDLHASTIHRLLGRRPGSRTRFRHDRTNRLPYDVVVVDETSMVSLTLMARLLDAVRPTARLILVGDPDQLASVEAGAVLGDIVRAEGHRSEILGRPVTNGVVTLDHTWRFQGSIAALARAIRAGDPGAALEVLHRNADAKESGHGEVELIEDGATDGLRADVTAALDEVTEAALEGDAATALDRLDTHRLLCAHRRGPHGVTRWSAEVARWREANPSGSDWYPGQPLLITANDYDAGLYNGDTGVIVQTPAGLRAAFARGGTPVLIPPTRLLEAQTLYALTVHRSQGSQFGRVTLILPPPDSPLLTRELLYTAATRAKTHLRILGTAEAIRAAITRPIARASGLRSLLGT